MEIEDINKIIEKINSGESTKEETLVLLKVLNAYVKAYKKLVDNLDYNFNTN